MKDQQVRQLFDEVTETDFGMFVVAVTLFTLVFVPATIVFVIWSQLQ